MSKLTKREEKEIQRLRKTQKPDTPVDIKYFERAQYDDTIDSIEGFNAYRRSYKKAKGGEKSKRKPDQKLIAIARAILKGKKHTTSKHTSARLFILLSGNGFTGSE